MLKIGAPHVKVNYISIKLIFHLFTYLGHIRQCWDSCEGLTFQCLTGMEASGIKLGDWHIPSMSLSHAPTPRVSRFWLHFSLYLRKQKLKQQIPRNLSDNGKKYGSWNPTLPLRTPNHPSFAPSMNKPDKVQCILQAFSRGREASTPVNEEEVNLQEGWKFKITTTVLGTTTTKKNWGLTFFFL